MLLPGDGEEEKGEEMTSLKRFGFIVAAILAAAAFAIVAGQARAGSATPNPQSACAADGNAGTGNIVFKDGQLVLSGCHAGDSSFDTTIPVQSGTCHGALNAQVENVVCVKQ